MSDSGYTWRELITEELTRKGETWADVEACTLREEDMDDIEVNGFTLWTHNRVYFPVSEGGALWVASAPRTPCDEITDTGEPCDYEPSTLLGIFKSMISGERQGE